MRKTAVAGWWALVMAACTPEPTAALFPAQVVDVATADVGPGDTAAPPAGALTGTWALATDWSSCAELGDLTEVRARSLIRVQLTQTGNHLHEVRELCWVGSTPALGLETVVPQAALDAVNPLTLDSVLLDDGAGGLAYASGIEVQVWGMDLKDPLGEAMPVVPSDPRIVDADGDGKPGVTYQLGTICDMYIGQRSVAAITAVRGQDGAFTGGAVRTNERLVLGATKGICETPSVVHSNDAHNAMRLVRVDGQGLALDGNGDGQVSCAEIVANQPKVVQWQEPDDARCL